MKVSSKVSLKVSRHPSTLRDRTVSAPGRYLVRSGGVYLFQIKMPCDIGGVPARTLRLSLGALPAREARVRADLLASLARNKFNEIRFAAMAQNDESENDGTKPLFDGGSPELTAAEIKGYLRAHLDMIGPKAPPSAPSQLAALQGLKGMVLLNRELAKGADANPLISENASLLQQAEIERIAKSFTEPQADAKAPAPVDLDRSNADQQSTQQHKTFSVPAAQTHEGLREPPDPGNGDAFTPEFMRDRRFATRAPSRLPLLSAVSEEYFAARAISVGINNKDIRTARYRMSVFLNLIGDHPIDTYVGSDLQAYVRLMACWPADKRHRPSDATPREIIESNRDLKFKPLKRSALEDGYVSIVKTIVRSKITELAYRDPFAGVRLRYPATAAPRETAEPLSSTKISDIFAAGVQGGILDEAMLPLLGHLTGRRLGLLVHLKGNDVREKYPGVWVAQTSGITLGKDGVWRRVPIKTNATTTFFILHDFLREIGFIDWAVRQGDNFLFRELIRLKDPSKSASSYMGRLFQRAGITANRKEVFHSLRGGNIDNMRKNKVDPRDRRMQAGHTLHDEHDLYGFSVITEESAKALASTPLQENVTYDVFKNLDFEKLSEARRGSGRRRLFQGGL